MPIIVMRKDSLKMKHSLRLTIILTLIFAVEHISAQQMHSSKIESPLLRHDCDIFVGTTHIPEGGKKASDVTLVLPNIGFNYKYWFDDHFAIGWYNNLLIQTFVINNDSHQDLVRAYPFVTSIVGVLRPWKHLSIFTGPGIEIDKNGSLFVYRFGLDYAINLSNDWQLTPRFHFDILGSDIEVYTLGLSIGRRF